MIEPDRVLRPLREAEPAIDRLQTYESPAALGEALRATWHAIELTLRTLLRSDETAPDAVRLSALSAEQMPTEAVLTELRRRDLITLPLAGRIHELQQAVRRAADGVVRAADADTALDVVRLLSADVAGVAQSRRPEDEVPRAEPAAAAARRAAVSDAAARDPGKTRTFDLRAVPRRPLYLAAIVGALLVVIMMLTWVFGRESDLQRGIAAFRQGEAGAAEQHFRTAIGRDDDNVTARLYLARILREQGRLQEAADQLRTAALTAPEDAAVRRELGYLFLDLNRPPSAVEQFRMAVELEPAEPLNWVGLVLALRQANDPTADEWLRRAPAEAQALVRTRAP
jgi:tetratricopeptide (TPR) repeat protein